MNFNDSEIPLKARFVTVEADQSSHGSNNVSKEQLRLDGENEELASRVRACVKEIQTHIKKVSKVTVTGAQFVFKESKDGLVLLFANQI